MSRKRHTPADERFFLVRSTAGVFNDGAAIAPHTHSWSQLIYATTGVTSVWTEHGSWVAPPHWAIWAPAGIAHALQFTGKTSLRTLYFRKTVAPPWRKSAVVAISPLLRELIVRATGIGMLDRRNRTHRALTELIVSEFRSCSVASLELQYPGSEAFRAIANAVAASVDKETHARIARRFGMSVRSLERGFVRETGISLGRWRRQARFLAALRRLGAGAPVKEAAAAAGYQSASAFIAAFRASFKTTPSRYFALSASPAEAPSSDRRSSRAVRESTRRSAPPSSTARRRR